MPPELVKHLTKHETPDMWDLARGNVFRMRHERYKETLEAQKLAPVCREEGLTQIVEKGQYLVTESAILVEEMGVANSC